jgi:hypothetical protein
MVREFNEGRERTSSIAATARRRSKAQALMPPWCRAGDRGGAPPERTQVNIAGNTRGARSDLLPKGSRRALGDNGQRIAGSYCKGFSPIDHPR